MAEDISRIPENDIPDNEDKLNSKMQIEADAFLNAIAGGADEDQADEAAFFAANPNGVVVDEEGEVLESGTKSQIKKGEKVEFVDDEAETTVEDPVEKSIDETVTEKLTEENTEEQAVTGPASSEQDEEEIAD